MFGFTFSNLESENERKVTTTCDEKYLVREKMDCKPFGPHFEKVAKV